MKNIKSIIFDLYGTVYDVHSVSEACERTFPGHGNAISTLWRQKQLEYTWLRSLMGRYVSFESATEDALRYTCGYYELALSDEQHRMLSDTYLHLKPFADSVAALTKLKAAGFQTGIISNGSNYSISQVVHNSGMESLFDQLISVEHVGVFKPDPRVYSLAEERIGHTREDILFISSNAWDASAARTFDFPVCWINRRGTPFDELGVHPNHIEKNLEGMADWLIAYH